MANALIDPRTSPYFGRGIGPEGDYVGAGNGNGLGYLEALMSLPGAEQFIIPSSSPNESGGRIDPDALAAYLQANGLSINDAAFKGGGQRYLTDASGAMVGAPQDYLFNDNAYFNMGLGMFGGAAAGMLGAGAGAGAGGGVEAGAAGGGVGGGGISTGVGGGTGITAGAGGGTGLTAGAGAGNALYVPTGYAGAGMGAGGGTAAAGGAGGLLGGMGGANTWANLAQAGIGLAGQNAALNAAENANAQSNDLMRYVYDTQRADNKPLVDLRNSVLPQIQGLLQNPGSVTSMPDYQFQFAEGQKSLNNGAAARGMTYSGAQGKALQRYGQDYAGTKLDQSLNRLTNVAGLGQVGSNNNQQATNQFGQGMSSNAQDMGASRAGAYIGGANMAGNALGNWFNQDQYNSLWGRKP